MQIEETKKVETGLKEPKTAQELLPLALETEDEIADSIYRYYMERENWPADLKDEVFEEIRKYLTTLLEDSERHGNIVRELQSKLSQNDG